MVVKDTIKLRKTVTSTYMLFHEAKTPEEKLALANYLGNLYASIICMGDDGIKFEKYRAFGGRKKYEQIMGRLDDYSDEALQSFLNNKDFHNSYFGEILPDVEEEMLKFCPLVFPYDDKLSRKKFFEIFEAFMSSIGQKELFDKFYNGHIYSSRIGQDDGNLGFTLYNPINGDTDLFIKDLNYDIHSLNTLVHEVGHGFDLSMLDRDVSKYNRYFYLSLYGEVISKLYERLLFRFLINNNICPNTAKDKFIDFNVISHDYFLMSYLLSIFDNDFLKGDKYIDCDSEELAKKVEKHVLDKQDIIDFFDRMGTIDLSESLNYAYGDIISLFLCDEVENCGFNGDAFRDFLRERTNLFDPEYLKSNGYGPKEYVKLYKSEVELVKK